MILEQLTITRSTYGPDKGRMSGRVKFSSAAGTVELQLGEEVSRAIVRICAEGIVQASKQVADQMAADVIEDTGAAPPALPPS